MAGSGDTSDDWNQILQHLGLLIDQPNISHADLQRIHEPVLIMPGQTHFTPASHPKVFNAIVETFLTEPFSRHDSIWTKQ